MIFFGLVFVLSGFVGLLGSYKHVLNMLLSLEMVMLGLMGLLSFYFVMNLNELVFIFCFLVMMVGEGVLGLSVLISLVRGYGQDGYLSFNCLQC